MSDTDRTLNLLAEATAALKRLLDGGHSTWLEWDVLRESWDFCLARGVLPPSIEEAQR